MSSHRPLQRQPASRRERPSSRTLPHAEQPRGRDRSPIASPLEQALHRLVEERDALRAELEESRAFGDRMMALSEEKHARIFELEKALAEREKRIAELEGENDALLEQGIAQSARVDELQSMHDNLVTATQVQSARLQAMTEELQNWTQQRRELEDENDALMAQGLAQAQRVELLSSHVSSREERVTQLEATLRMLAEADERL